MTKTYIGISRDHSASMLYLASHAMRDYNSNLETIKAESATAEQETIISVVKCGVGRRGIVEREITNSTLKSVGNLHHYDTTGMATPLFDSVIELINIMSQVPDASDRTVAFLVMVITDGYDNASSYSGEMLAARIAELQKTDRWTFVFRIPPGHKKNLVALGIPEHNILEWELTTRGLETATQITTAPLSSYYKGRVAGATATRSFFVKPNLQNLDPKTLAANMHDISYEVSKIFVPPKRDGDKIKDIVEDSLGVTFNPGSAFYQLTKKEKEIQEYKRILVSDKKTSKIYSGNNAKSLLNLPLTGFFKLEPAESYSNYEIFIQSTSVNRKIVGGTVIIYWPSPK